MKIQVRLLESALIMALFSMASVQAQVIVEPAYGKAVTALEVEVTSTHLRAVITDTPGATTFTFVSTGSNADVIAGLGPVLLDLSLASTPVPLTLDSQGRGEFVVPLPVLDPGVAIYAQVGIIRTSGEVRVSNRAGFFNPRQRAVISGRRFPATSVDRFPGALTVGDWNGDGFPDYATAYTGGFAEWLLGTNLGPGPNGIEFGLGGGRLLSPGSEDLTFSDLNGDGNSDWVSSSSTRNQVEVSLASGTGSFHLAVAYAVPGRPGALEVADTNADGILDLVVALPLRQEVAVLAGGAGGSFGAAAIFAVGRAPVDLVVADINADGLPDIVTANGVARDLSVLVGVGGGVVGSPVHIPMGSNANSLATGLIDGDPHSDLACATQAGFVLLHGGPGGLAMGAGGPDTVHRSDVELVDLNGDGNLDLVAGGDTIAVFLGDGLGGMTFESQVPASCRELKVADFDQDGALDLLFSGHEITLLLGKPGRVSFDAPLWLPGNGEGLLAFDVNADGLTDLFRSSPPAVELGVIGGGFMTPLAVPFPALAVSDLNQDGVVDMLGASGSEIHIAHGNGQGAFAAAPFVTSRFPITAIAAGELTGDSIPDLLVGHRLVSNALSLHPGLAGGGYGPAVPIAVVASTSFGLQSILDLEIVDWDGDGNQDIIAATGMRLTILYGTPSGQLMPPVHIFAGLYPQHVEVVDLDRDGVLDAVVTAASDGFDPAYFMVLRQTGTQLSYERLFTPHFIPGPVRAGDMNADGHLDLVCHDRESGGLSVFLATGTGSFELGTHHLGGQSLRSLALVDYDGNGLLDVMAASASSLFISLNDRL